MNEAGGLTGSIGQIVLLALDFIFQAFRVAPRRRNLCLNLLV